MARTASDLSSDEMSSIRDKIRDAKRLGMNTVNIFTNKTDVDSLMSKLNTFIELKSMQEGKKK